MQRFLLIECMSLDEHQPQQGGGGESWHSLEFISVLLFVGFTTCVSLYCETRPDV